MEKALCICNDDLIITIPYVCYPEMISQNYIVRR